MPDLLALAYRKALLAADPSLVQLHFDVAVIDRYRGQAGFQIIRTNSAGRVRKQGGWGVDFGIPDGERTIHASWQALAYALPEDERAHWAMHAAEAAGISANFMRMQLSPGSCFDDGDVRDWAAGE